MKPPPDLLRKEVIECQNWMMEQFRGKDGKNQGSPVNCPSDLCIEEDFGQDLAIGQRGFYIKVMQPQGVSAVDFGVLASDLS